MSSERERASERDHLLDRLHNIRAILPVFAQELASARRQSAQLRLENASLMRQVRELQRERVLVDTTSPDDGRRKAGRARGARSPQLVSGIISIAPQGHSSTQMPQPLQ